MRDDFNQSATDSFNIASIGDPSGYIMQDMKGAGMVSGLAEMGFKTEAAAPAVNHTAPAAKQKFGL